MNKKIVLSLAILASGCYLNAADNFSSMISQGNISGQMRMFYIDRKFQGTQGVTTHRNSTAIGGHLKYETAEYNNFKMAAAFYTTNAIHAIDRSVHGPSLLGTGQTNYSILGEAYVDYNFINFGSKTKARLGYQRFDTPMMGSDDCRMVPNTFEAYKLVNKDIKNVTLQLAQINGIAYGTYSNLFINGGIVSTTSGYSSLPYRAGKYYNLGKLTTGKNTAGVTNILIKYKNKNFFATASNDYAWNMYNTLYLEAGTTWNCLLNDNIHPFVKAQYIKQNSVGGKYMQYSAMGGDGKIDSHYIATKVGAKYAGLTAAVAYSKTGANADSDTKYKNAITSQFGGMPAYTVSMVSRHQFLAGTKALKYTAKYDFKKLGLNLNALAYYASYDMDANSGYGIKRTATEAGFDVKYYPKSIKGLQLRVRANFPRKFAEDTTGDKGWNEYRFIANYTF
jgi:hypothetical protein